MRRPGGIFEAYREGVLTATYDTFTCAHCNTTVFLKAATEPTLAGSILFGQPHWESDGMGVCLQCCGQFDRGLICPACEKEQHRVGRCVNFERRLEMHERRELLLGAALPG